MAGLTPEEKRRIRKELQRRAQAKAAWKAGGGTKSPSASMLGWAGFGKLGAKKADQIAYINSLGAMGATSGWKKAYKGAAKKGAAKGKAKVAAYISRKGAGATRPSPAVKKTTSATVNPKTGTKNVDISGNKPGPKPSGYSATAKKWYKTHMSKQTTDAGRKKVRATLKAKHKKGLL